MMNLNIQTVPFALGAGILTTHTCTCVEHDVYCNRYFFIQSFMYVRIACFFRFTSLYFMCT